MEDTASEGSTHTSVETMSPSLEEEQPGGRPRTDERSRHIRSDERDYLEQLNDQQEKLGDEIQRAIEAQGDVIGEGKSFEEIKAEAESKLNIASQSQQLSPESVGEVHGAAPDASVKPSRVCFAADHSVTSDPNSCDPDQSRHFGFAQENGPEDQGFAIPSSEEVFDSMSEDFTTQTPSGGSVLSIISDALIRLSGMIPSMNGNPAALAQIQETIRWLSGLLTQHDAGELSASQEADLARQIADRLSGIASMMGGSTQGGSTQGGPGGFGPPNMQMIVTMMEKMIEKLPKVFAIFEEEGIPVSQEAREAYENGAALFRELKPLCEAEAQKCFELKNVAVFFEKMRPSMEKAITESGKFEVGMRIHQLISDGMEGMPMQGPGPSGGQFGPPSGGNDGPPPPGYDGRPPSGQYGPPPGYPTGDHGSQSGYPSGDYGPPPNGYDATGGDRRFPEGFRGSEDKGQPAGYDEGQYR